MNVMMVPDWLAVLGARPIDDTAHGAIILDDPARVLWVADGALDVFLARDFDGSAEQRPYARIEAGGSAWAMALTEGWRLRAAPLPGTTLYEVRRNALLARIGREGADEAERQLAAWLRIAHEFRLSDAFPRRSLVLRPGVAVVCETGAALVPQTHLVWVRLDAGSASLPGAVRIDAPATVGITDNTWLEAGIGLAGTTRSSAQLAAAGELTAAVDATLARFGDLVLRRLRVADRREWQRLAARSEEDSREMSRVAANFRSILEPSVLDREANAEGDTLLAACQIIGRSMGIEFVAHAAAQHGRPQIDPLGNIVRASGIRTRAVALRSGWWCGDHGPLLAFAGDERRAVALMPTGNGGYDLHDPGRGELQRIDAKLASNIAPIAFTFYRTLGARALKTFDLIRFATRGLGRDFVLIAMLGALGGLAGLVGPYLTEPLFNDAIPSADRIQVLQVVIALLAATLAETLFGITRNLSVLRVEGLADLSAQSGVWDRLLRLPVPFFRSYSVGDLALRANAIDAIRSAIAGTTVNTLLSAVFSLISLALLFHFSVMLASITLVLVAVLVMLMIPGTWIKLRFERQATEVSGQLSGLVFQLLTGIAKLRVSATEGRAFSRWARLYAVQERTVLQSNLADGYLEVLIGVFPILASFVLFLAVATQGHDGNALTTGAFLGFNAAFGTFLGAVLGVFSTVVGTLKTLPLYERLRPVLNTEPEVTTGRADPGLLAGRLEVSGVSFRYAEHSPLVLQDVSVQIRPGEFIAFVGTSGSGKSTLMRLLLGFERPTTGSIFFDGQDLAGLDVGAVRRQMGVVLQNSQLLGGDIFSNICGAAPLAIKDVMEALRACGMEEDIKAMPMGVHTVLPEGGITLSGGQRQRLLLARAVAMRPRILLLDEATSALDNRNQALITASLDALKVSRVVVAHRLSTVINADHIYVFDAGRIVQSGTYAELIAQEGLFRRLASRQTADVE